ncbi:MULTISPECIES: tRNA (guanosine(37)-N1)-methyltransferase TrmD [unclassified Oceanispirochaeta]|uniref:tRNA (guanosine(37)-N1)-methyltransferase TrmD n=1 Tax=unclassified Oceanispirochaeta TaxID=2635722 RepID=UPI000E09BE81|nr:MULTISPECIES: tRNA (guanosine(37)-N1)-methyltransferase TrmD [unclassified Oceanispirochaeta]MBF9017632.1 tRNA (guanosine(37)-N1)-methyltransferase TrmD [Oceanispirochaeta sp. M2]NPD74204.1 tRNA (guanosine(37)-N1)-methyltransferase TrmD [Oceanispirochaeta sp. M1]RDG29910.1 tRNA (guanosine(37)-N1)-methyltransferase TrmD [Oceanispirochaeta sp. M1]
MKFTILTLFPEIVEAFFSSSIMKKAVDKGLIEYNLVNIRDFALDKHRTCDDAPYGGGAGMVLKTEPLALALDSVKASDIRTVFPTPSGVSYTQKIADELSQEKEIVLICGRYEGIDQRIIDLYVDDEVCIGDYVISSGEIASLVVIDSIYRLCDGVITQESLKEESFQGKLLEYPHYTRPEVFRDIKVPDILLSGHHAKIVKWRHERRLEKTIKNRPDLLDEVEFDRRMK